MRAVVAAAVVGAIWGATIALTFVEETVLLDVGRFLAVAFVAGACTRDVRLGALAGAAMALAHFGAMELTPWRGIEAAADETLRAEEAAFIADVFRQGTRIHWAIVAGAVVLGAAGAWRTKVAWALLAGALVADAVNRADGLVNLAGAVAVAQAVIGVRVARRHVGRDVALVAALVPIALVLLAPTLLGAEIIAQDQDAVIR